MDDESDDGRGSNASSYIDRNLVMPVGKFDNSGRRRILHNDAASFTVYASSKLSEVDDIETILETACCHENCYKDLSWSDCALIRGRLVQLMEYCPNRTTLRKFIVALLNERLHDSPGDGFVYVDTNIAGKHVCVQLFIRVIGIGADFFDSCLYAFKTGDVLVSSTSPGKNYLLPNTIKAIARISVEVSSIGQFNPSSGHVMLPRGIRKKEFSRTADSGAAFLNSRLLKLYVGVGLRKRGTIDFLTCSICRTLSAQLSKLKTISNIMRSDAGRFVPTARKTVPDVIDAHLKHCRKVVLVRVCDAFKRKATAFAKKNGMETASVDVRLIVRDEDVEDDAYLQHLNDGNVEISMDAIRESETLLIVDAESRYVQGRMRANRLDELNAAPTRDVVAANAMLESSSVQIRSLMNVHNEHVTQERLIVQVANEMCVAYPSQVLALQFDGCGKDKTKLPCFVDKDKSTVPAKALMCPLLTWQLAVPSGCHKSVSRFKLKNFDYIIPFTWCGTLSTDILISTLLDLLLNQLQTEIPPIISIVFDNANSNKSIGTLRALAAVMENIPLLREMHLYFPTVGHTHGSVDQHFSIIAKRMRSQNVLTVQDLVRVVKGNDDFTVAITKFPLYKVSQKVENVGVALRGIAHQHYFLLFKNADGDVLFNHDAFLRFAEPLSARVQYHLRSTRALLPLTDAEMRNGVPVFPPSLTGRADRTVEFGRLRPSKVLWTYFNDEVTKLKNLIPSVFENWERIMRELDDTHRLLMSNADQRYTMLAVLNAVAAKCYKGDDTCRGTVGLGKMDDSEEARINQQLRMLGKNVRTSPLSAELKETIKNFRPLAIREVLGVLKGVDADIEAKYVEAVNSYEFRGSAAIASAHAECARKLAERMEREGSVMPSTQRRAIMRRARPDFARSVRGYSDDDDDDRETVAPPAQSKQQMKLLAREALIKSRSQPSGKAVPSSAKNITSRSTKALKPPSRAESTSPALIPPRKSYKRGAPANAPSRTNVPVRAAPVVARRTDLSKPKSGGPRSSAASLRSSLGDTTVKEEQDSLVAPRAARAASLSALEPSELGRQSGEGARAPSIGSDGGVSQLSMFRSQTRSGTAYRVPAVERASSREASQRPRKSSATPDVADVSKGAPSDSAKGNEAHGRATTSVPSSLTALAHGHHIFAPGYKGVDLTERDLPVYNQRPPVNVAPTSSPSRRRVAESAPESLAEESTDAKKARVDEREGSHSPQL